MSASEIKPKACVVGNTTYCTYRAYLSLAPDFVAPPRITAISVTSGPATGGTSVVISGTGFAAATAVAFGDVPAASFTINSDTSITAISPPSNEGTVDVTVTTPGGTSAASDQFTFVPAPVVTAVSPQSGAVNGGTEVTITGENFFDVVAVYFGGTGAGFTLDTDSSITAWSPASEEADTVHVTLESIGGTSSTSAADRFTYVISPCGNGRLDTGEQCDDGNPYDGDGCSTQCRIEPCFTCAGQPSACSPAPPGTSCDDGNPCTVGEACDGLGACTGFTSCRVDTPCSLCGQMCTQPAPDVCQCE